MATALHRHAKRIRLSEFKGITPTDLKISFTEAELDFIHNMDRNSEPVNARDGRPRTGDFLSRK